ncbi:MAG: hypothetical protein KF709_12050 [Gemmatimonadaceae bacterium]|nr:hypothetical protein [Gemmatimonadaceae bacterium]
MRRLLLLLVLCASGCNDGFSQWLTIVVPPEIESIPRGEHRVAVFGYDPSLADASATLLVELRVPFSHVVGSSTRQTLPLQATVPRGYRVYLSVASCERRLVGSTYMLWDGQSDIGTPREVVMQRVPTQVPCEQLWGPGTSGPP